MAVPLDDEFTIPEQIGPEKAGNAPSDRADGGKPARDMSLAGPVVTIDLDAVRANYRLVRDLGTPATVAPVVKCDGYGLGAVAIARTLIDHEQATCLFVAHAQEGRELRTGLNTMIDDADQPEIFVLNGPTDTSLSLFKEYALTPILNSLNQANLWANAYPEIPAGLHVDTGMNRLGLMPDKLIAVKAIPDLPINLVMSHLACARDFDNPMNARQRAKFLSAATQFPGARLSLSSSGGGLAHASYHYSMIRLGLSLYGGSVTDTPDKRLKPVATLSAPIIQVREIKRGEHVGYDATWTASRNSRLATLAIGYGDGLPRSLSNKGSVALPGASGGQLFPIVGRISMDLVTIDITDAPSGIAIGDHGQIFGTILPIDKVADTADTVAYELLTRLGPRVSRRYIGG